jgi:hypothetical protein
VVQKDVAWPELETRSVDRAENSLVNALTEKSENLKAKFTATFSWRRVYLQKPEGSTQKQ